jgi:hypothetical protein
MMLSVAHFKMGVTVVQYKTAVALAVVVTKIVGQLTCESVSDMINNC